MCFFISSDADCTFNFANLVKPKASLSVVSQFTGDSTHSACTNNCLNSAANDMNCWAATFNLLLGECVLYYSEDPFLLSQESNLEPSLLLYYTKQCFNGKLANFKYCTFGNFREGFIFTKLRIRCEVSRKQNPRKMAKSLCRFLT